MGDERDMNPDWKPFSEPLRATLMRTVAIAIVAGAIAAHFAGGLARWPFFTALMLWPSLGGHWIELRFLNWLRPRLPASRGVQALARLGVWFIAGFIFAFAMHLTAAGLTSHRPIYLPPWWLGGVAFIGIELLVHMGLQLRGQDSFYNGRG